MENHTKLSAPDDNSASDELLNLGTLLGHSQAFGLVATRCTAAAAESLKSIHDSGEYMKVEATWDEFCRRRVGISRGYANRLIRHLEEFGPNYFRLAEVMEISGGMYRLIAGSIDDAGMKIDGETVPIRRENREKIRAAVESARSAVRAEKDTPQKLDGIRKHLKAFLSGATAIRETKDDQVELLVLLEDGLRQVYDLVIAARKELLV